MSNFIFLSHICWADLDLYKIYNYIKQNLGVLFYDFNKCICMWATTPQLRIKTWKIPFCSFVVNHLLSPPSLGKQLRDTVYQLTIVNLIYITLTHKLQKTAQEAKPLWLQVQNHHDFSIITSLPIFALFFILGLSRESQTYSCNESRRIPTSSEPSSGSWHTWIYLFPRHICPTSPLAMQETGVWSLDLEDALEEKIATHSSILP